MASGRTAIVALVSILLAAIAVAAVVLLWLPADQTPGSSEPGAMQQRLDATILQRSDYTGLDTSLLQQGALPVQPPPNIGKANPFL